MDPSDLACDRPSLGVGGDILPFGWFRASSDDEAVGLIAEYVRIGTVLGDEFALIKVRFRNELRDNLGRTIGKSRQLSHDEGLR